MREKETAPFPLCDLKPPSIPKRERAGEFSLLFAGEREISFPFFT